MGAQLLESISYVKKNENYYFEHFIRFSISWYYHYSWENTIYKKKSVISMIYQELCSKDSQMIFCSQVNISWHS